jgi:predicted CopG family antitoxin
MAATTVSVSEETRRELMGLKHERGKGSVDELLQDLLVEYRKMRFHDAAGLFRERLSESDLDVEDLIE